MVDEEIETRIAKTVGFTDLETYKKTQEIYLQGIPELIEAVVLRQISIEKAIEIARLTKKRPTAYYDIVVNRLSLAAEL